MMIPSVLTLTTKYVMVADTFGMYGSFLGVILPQSAGLVPFGILLLRGFFDGLPHDLFDAAELDGANSVKQFLHVCVPLGMPILVTLVLMNFQTSWNDYLWPLLMLTDRAKMTLPIALSTLNGQYNTEYNVLMAGSLISMIPIILIYLFAQRYFKNGLMAGGIKG